MKKMTNWILAAALALAAGFAASQDADPMDLDALLGTWNMVYDMGQGRQTGTITISRNDDGSPGISMTTSGGGSSEAREISIEADTLSYTRDISAQGQSITVNYTAKLMEGKLEGSFELDLGGAGGGLGGPTTWTATKAD
jgi:hypothetical protein